MKQRSPIAVFFLTLITFGIYGLVWQVKTKNEMNALGADIPTAWLLIIPFVNYYWLWKYSQGVEKVTNGKLSGVLAFVLLFLVGVIGMAIIQNEFNTASPVAAGAPGFAPASPVATDGSFGTPVAAPTAPVIAETPAPTDTPQSPVQG
jgi:hypothetical protein